MTTKKTTEQPIPEPISATTGAYLERLLEGHEKFAAALEASRARNARIADKFFATLLANQREALALGKAMASAPTAYGKNMEAAMHSLSAAQERALDFAKTVYREQADASGELRDAATRAFEAARKLAPSADKLGAWWAPAAK